MAVRAVAMITDFTWGAEDNIFVKLHISSGQMDHTDVSLGPYSDSVIEVTLNNQIRDDVKAYVEANMNIVFDVIDTVKVLTRLQ